MSLLFAVQPSQLPPQHQVKEKKGELEKAKTGFVRRGTDFLRNLINSSVDAVIAAGVGDEWLGGKGLGGRW